MHSGRSRVNVISLFPIFRIFFVKHRSLGPVFYSWPHVSCNDRLRINSFRKIFNLSSDNGLSPGRHQAIIWTNAGILLFEPRGIRLSELLIEIKTFLFTETHLKLWSAKWRLYGLRPIDRKPTLFKWKLWVRKPAFVNMITRFKIHFSWPYHMIHIYP